MTLLTPPREPVRELSDFSTPAMSAFPVKSSPISIALAI
jgi:hypothetical protein